MATTGLHLLLTYRCTHTCDHCFLSCSPFRAGTFTPELVGEVLTEAGKIGTIKDIWIEGGEPFLVYPLLVATVGLAADAGFETGIVTNSYWAETDDLADLFLAPLAGAGLTTLTVSDDTFHWGEPDGDAPSPPKIAMAAAKRAGIETFPICIPHPDDDEGIVYRGRAVSKLTEGRETKPARTFTECTGEEFADPGRFHLDGHGNVHLCQGIVMGNLTKTPLSEIVANWDPHAHAIAGPLVDGGPAKLAEAIAPDLLDEEFVSDCHLCWQARETAQDRFPAELAPPELYAPK